MSTLTIPNTFAAATYLRADHVDGNLAAIKTYLDTAVVAGAQVGIQSPQISAGARFALSQLAYGKTLAFFSWSGPMVAVPGTQTNKASFCAPAAIEIVAARMRLFMVALGVIPSQMTATVEIAVSDYGSSSWTTGQVRNIAADNYEADNWSDWRPPPGGVIRVPAKTFVGVRLVASHANVRLVCVQLAYTCPHVAV